MLSGQGLRMRCGRLRVGRHCLLPPMGVVDVAIENPATGTSSDYILLQMMFDSSKNIIWVS